MIIRPRESDTDLHITLRTARCKVGLSRLQSHALDRRLVRLPFGALLPLSNLDHAQLAASAAGQQHLVDRTVEDRTGAMRLQTRERGDATLSRLQQRVPERDVTMVDRFAGGHYDRGAAEEREVATLFGMGFDSLRLRSGI